jgi:hypothetical protein
MPGHPGRCRADYQRLFKHPGIPAPPHGSGSAAPAGSLGGADELAIPRMLPLPYAGRSAATALATPQRTGLHPRRSTLLTFPPVGWSGWPCRSRQVPSVHPGHIASFVFTFPLARQSASRDPSCTGRDRPLPPDGSRSHRIAATGLLCAIWSSSGRPNTRGTVGPSAFERSEPAKPVRLSRRTRRSPRTEQRVPNGQRRRRLQDRGRGASRRGEDYDLARTAQHRTTRVPLNAPKTALTCGKGYRKLSGQRSRRSMTKSRFCRRWPNVARARSPHNI